MGCSPSIENHSSSKTNNLNELNKDSIRLDAIQNNSDNYEGENIRTEIFKMADMASSLEQSQFHNTNKPAFEKELKNGGKEVVLSKKISGFRWQDVDLCSLLSDLNLEDGSTHWWDVVDQLCVKEPPIVRAEIEVYKFNLKYILTRYL